MPSGLGHNWSDAMNVEVTAAEPAAVEADTLALAAGGLRVRELDRLFEGRLARAAADADPVAVVPVTTELRARRVVLVALDESEPEDLRTAAARAAIAACSCSSAPQTMRRSTPGVRASLFQRPAP